MIDLACIFTTGGVILFYKAFCTLKYDIVTDLITKNLINDRLDEKSYLDYLTQLNISIGTKIEILEKFSFDQSISIKIENTMQHISNEVAKHLLIKIS